MDEAILVYTTWPDAETAGAAAQAAVEARAAACANIMAPIASIYRWEGEVERAVETPVLFKTTAAAAERLRALILARHPYDLPCFIALPVDAARSHPAYLAWLTAESGSPPPPASGEGS
ncbi:MAG TPA: divalent-cation tolerance protein CutA [Caulobacteraceae bacterium]|jgi:periplasmic divalent cation tolerance protein|nr:divalent-cation tolerance protein CutA [Caulobacteraceae bacterium]